jgi:hypothetical protein
MKASGAASAYYLDERLSLAESTCRFATNDFGRASTQEGFYVLAIRRSGYRDCVFRFSEHERADARSMLEMLNRVEEQSVVDGQSDFRA